MLRIHPSDAIVCFHGQPSAAFILFYPRRSAWFSRFQTLEQISSRTTNVGHTHTHNNFPQHYSYTHISCTSTGYTSAESFSAWGDVKYIPSLTLKHPNSSLWAKFIVSFNRLSSVPDLWPFWPFCPCFFLSSMLLCCSLSFVFFSLNDNSKSWEKRSGYMLFNLYYLVCGLSVASFSFCWVCVCVFMPSS